MEQIKSKGYFTLKIKTKDGYMFLPSPLKKKGLQKFQILQPIFLLRGQAIAYKNFLYPNRKDITICKVKILSD
jgi:hypothetical protein